MLLLVGHSLIAGLRTLDRCDDQRLADRVQIRNGDMGGPLPAEQALDRVADVHALRLQQRGCPGRKSPKRAVRRPPRPYKRAIERERSLWETRRALKILRAARTVVQQRRLRHQPGRAGGRLQRQGIG